MSGEYVLFYKAYLRGEKNSSHVHKTGSFYLLLVLFKISDEPPCLFCMGVPPPRGGGFVALM